MVAMCLVKDQAKRPTAEKLMKHTFFKQAKPPELSVKHLLADLPPLWDRVKALQLKDAAQLALKKMPSSEQEAISQSEYQRGVSAWNFDVEDLKAQASLILDDEDFPETKDDDRGSRRFFNNKEPSTSRSILRKSPQTEEFDCRKNISPDTQCVSTDDEVREKNPVDSSSQDKYDKSEGNMKNELAPSASKLEVVSGYRKSQVGKKHQTYSGPLLPSSVHSNSLSDRGRTSERFEGDNPGSSEKHKRDGRKASNFSGPLMLPNRASANSLSAPMRTSGYGDSLDDKSKANVVQIKGRFSVTSEHVDPVKEAPTSNAQRRSSQGSPLRKSASVGDWLVNSKQMPISQNSKEMNNSSVPASLLMPHLQNLFQQTSFQQDLIMSLLSSLQQNESADDLQSSVPSNARNLENEFIDTAPTERERLLLIRISELQARMINLTDELTAARLKHIQLQQQLAVYCREEERTDEMEDT